MKRTKEWGESERTSIGDSIPGMLPGVTPGEIPGVNPGEVFTISVNQWRWFKLPVAEILEPRKIRDEWTQRLGGPDQFSGVRKCATQQCMTIYQNATRILLAR